MTKENAEGLRCGSPRRDHLDGYRRKTDSEDLLFDVGWPKICGTK